MAVISASGSFPLHYAGTTITWQPSLYGQATGDEIAASQQFSIGNRYTVRGFNGTSTLVAESGYYFRNDLVFPHPHSPVAFYLGIDTGCVWGPSTAFLIGRSLSGFAMGARSAGRHFSFDASVGVPLSAPPGFTNGNPVLAVDVNVRT
jgi:hemolysin activation/secretion protein